MSCWCCSDEGHPHCCCHSSHHHCGCHPERHHGSCRCGHHEPRGPREGRPLFSSREEYMARLEEERDLLERRLRFLSQELEDLRKGGHPKEEA
jgi:hypothetical protein